MCHKNLYAVYYRPSDLFDHLCLRYSYSARASSPSTRTANYTLGMKKSSLFALGTQYTILYTSTGLCPSIYSGNCPCTVVNPYTHQLSTFSDAEASFITFFFCFPVFRAAISLVFVEFQYDKATRHYMYLSIN